VFAVLVGGLVEVEKTWTVRKVVGELGRALRKARLGDRTGVLRWVSRQILGLPRALVVAEILRWGKVVRRFVGRLVRIGSSVPTHAGPLPRAGGDCIL
jgi:hypothetical protein